MIKEDNERWMATLNLHDAGHIQPLEIKSRDRRVFVCEKCFTRRTVEDKFCASCGGTSFHLFNSLEGLTFFCPHCQTQVKSNLYNCGQCGSLIKVYFSNKRAKRSKLVSTE